MTEASPLTFSCVATRHQTHKVRVGSVEIGGGQTIIVQSMTNTDTADVNSTSEQIMALAEAGSEIVRITVDREEAASAVPYIVDKIRHEGYMTPIVGDFHYNGHRLLKSYPEMAKALDKYRINPGNVGFGAKKDQQFSKIIEIALANDKPIRIGVNWGSLDQAMLKRLMDENAKATHPKPSRTILHDALVQSSLFSAKEAERLGMAMDKIILSAKVSQVQDLIAIYQQLSRHSQYALHLGLTEAGMGSKGIVSSSAALAILLQQGIGDTIRYSLTPEPGGDRCKEVFAAQELLQSMALRQFMPLVTACPGCGRTTSTVFQTLAQDIEQQLRLSMPVWRQRYPGVEQLNIAVMGCIVNGPGESRHADIGISLPGIGENPAAPVFIDGEKVQTLRGNNIANEFKDILENYIHQRFG